MAVIAGVALIAMYIMTNYMSETAPKFGLTPVVTA